MYSCGTSRPTHVFVSESVPFHTESLSAENCTGYSPGSLGQVGAIRGHVAKLGHLHSFDVGVPKGGNASTFLYLHKCLSLSQNIFLDRVAAQVQELQDLRPWNSSGKQFLTAHKALYAPNRTLLRQTYGYHVLEHEYLSDEALSGSKRGKQSLQLAVVQVEMARVMLAGHVQRQNTASSHVIVPG